MRLSKVIALISLALAVTTVSAQPEELLGEVAEVANPRLTAGPDGAMHLVYEGWLGAQGAIAHRIYEEGFWSEEHVLATAPEGLFDPAVAVGTDGTVHVAWSTQSGGEIVHRALREGLWTDALVIPGGDLGAGEVPQMAARPDGGAEIVWQALHGSQYHVVHASLEADGSISGPRTIECQSPGGFNVYPSVFLTPSPVACWYEAIDGELTLRVAELVPGPQWRRIPLIDLLQVNLSRLPYIHLGGDGQWVALWHDAEPRSDRVLFGRGGPPDFGAPEIVDGNPGMDNVSPSAVELASGRWAIIWRGESSVGIEIYLALESPDGWSQRLLSAGQTVAPAQPVVCEDGDGLIHALWVSDAHAGGTGRLSHIAVAPF
ncbi:hypothetical protein JXA47_16330 [Candidatus Sumerlaeota bacterium]|nr:hypothetical protein [Candidatus Sumerlaeota bacterium]